LFVHGHLNFDGNFQSTVMRNVLHIEIVYKDAKDHGSLGFRLTELFSNSGHIEI